MTTIHNDDFNSRKVRFVEKRSKSAISRLMVPPVGCLLLVSFYFLPLLTLGCYKTSFEAKHNDQRGKDYSFASANLHGISQSVWSRCPCLSPSIDLISDRILFAVRLLYKMVPKHRIVSNQTLLLHNKLK